MRDLEREQLAVIEKYGLSELPYFPLASGLLTGKIQEGSCRTERNTSGKQALADKYHSEANLEKVELLRKFAEDRGHTLLKLAFSWLLSHQAVASVIAGATKPEQIEANAEAGDWEAQA